MISKTAAKSRTMTEFSSEVLKLSQAQALNENYIPTRIAELDRVWLPPSVAEIALLVPVSRPAAREKALA